MRYAAIKNNVVVATYEGGSAPQFAPGTYDSVRNVGDLDIRIGYIWNGFTLIEPPTVIDAQMSEVVRGFYFDLRTMRDRDYSGMTPAQALQVLVPDFKKLARIVLLIGKKQQQDTRDTDGDL